MAELVKECTEIGDTTGAMGAADAGVDATSSTPLVEGKKKTVDLKDPYSVKRLLDDTTSEVHEHDAVGALLTPSIFPVVCVGLPLIE